MFTSPKWVKWITVKLTHSLLPISRKHKLSSEITHIKGERAYKGGTCFSGTKFISVGGNAWNSQRLN